MFSRFLNTPWVDRSSLTSFLKIKEVKEKFKETFKKPSIKLEGEILAPPQTTNYGLVGTAFDYLMRFILEYQNHQAITFPWVAEQVPDYLDKNIIVGDTLEEIKKINEVVEFAPSMIEFAKEEHKKFIKTGEVDVKLINACLLLAQTDIIFRTGKPPRDYGNIDDGDIEDLLQLMKAITIEDFIAKDYCILNPTFGEGSRLVGGADADIIMDGVLIDIKTTKYLDFKRDYYDQLIGYYVLTRIGGIDGIEENPEIKELAVYFSRHAKLVKFPIEEVLRDVNLDDFIAWFTETAEEHFPTVRLKK